MLISYDEISAFVDKQIVCKGRLFVISCHAGFENGMGGLDVLVSMINPDNDCAVKIFHIVWSPFDKVEYHKLYFQKKFFGVIKNLVVLFFVFK